MTEKPPIFKPVRIEGISWLLSWMWAFGLLALIVFAFNRSAGDMIIFTICEISVLLTSHWVISRTS